MAPVQSTLRPTFLPFPDINNTFSSSSIPQITSFNNETWVAFSLMLDRSRASSQEGLSLVEYQQMLDWITDAGPQKVLTDKEAKRKSWTKVNFHYQDRKLWQNPHKHHSEARQVLAKPEILDAIVTIHNSIGHAGQEATAKNVSQTYHFVTCEEIIFVIKLCEICHWKAPGKSKGSLKPIILT